METEIKKIETVRKTDKESDEKLSLALELFRRQYPIVTSADLQAFILGWEACKNS